jgi:hypothetical protein
MAGSLNRLGQWALELHGSVNVLLNNNQNLVQAYDHIFQRVINRSLQLLNTNKPRIALPLLEFFAQFMKANQKVTDID